MDLFLTLMPTSQFLKLSRTVKNKQKCLEYVLEKKVSSESGKIHSTTT